MNTEWGPQVPLYPTLVPPMFPYFGGKRKVAHAVWQRLGNVQNYVEPFFGSGAVLFARPHPQKIETVNDKDRFLSNFWRAVQFAPASVVEWADWPVNEADLHARHLWLVNEGVKVLEALDLENDPFAFDEQVAGWWWWGICQWIGSGWCSPSARNKDGTMWNQRPDIGGIGLGMNRKVIIGRGANRREVTKKLPHLHGGRGINRNVPMHENSIPAIGRSGSGVHRQIPHLTGGKGLNRTLPQHIPHISDTGVGLNRLRRMEENTRREYISTLVHQVQERLRDVRVCCGDWKRVLGPSPTTHLGMTAVFLDPPYSHEVRDSEIYTEESGSVASDVREWAIEHGEDPLLRIALCGYDTEHNMPPSWSVLRWKATGGYGSQGNNRARDNARRETIWFSPACLRVDKHLQSIMEFE